MERSVLREVLLTHMHDLNGKTMDCFKPAGNQLTEAFMLHVGLPMLASPLLVSATAMRCRTDDVVSLSQPMALTKILFHLHYDGEVLTLVHLFDKVSTNRFKRSSGGDLLVHANCIRGPVIYKNVEGDEILVSPQSFFAA